MKEIVRELQRGHLDDAVTQKSCLCFEMRRKRKLVVDPESYSVPPVGASVAKAGLKMMGAR